MVSPWFGFICMLNYSSVLTWLNDIKTDTEITYSDYNLKQLVHYMFNTNYNYVKRTNLNFMSFLLTW
jgi:hypothetical protein